MIYGLYHSAAGMLTSEYQQALTANNLANAETVGFKQALATFAERIPAADAGRRFGPTNRNLSDISGGLWLGKTYTDYDSGPLRRTEAPSDLALDGDGFFVVEAGDQPLLTRDGRFTIDPDGLLRSVTDGAPLVGAGGVPVHVNPRGGELTIDGEGRILQDGGTVGRLALTTVDDLQALQPVGRGRYAFDPEATLPARARVFQGYVEQSGVEPILETVEMIETSRAYQLNARMLSMQDESIGRLISMVT